MLKWAVRLKVGCDLAKRQGRPVPSPPFPFLPGLSSGHWPPHREEKGVGVSPIFRYKLLFRCASGRQQFLLEISSKHRPGVGWLRLQFLVIEESYAGARECSAGKKFSFGHFIPNSVWCFNIPMHSDVCRASTSNRVSVWVCRPESGTIIFF